MKRKEQIETLQRQLRAAMHFNEQMRQQVKELKAENQRLSEKLQWSGSRIHTYVDGLKIQGTDPL